MIIDFGKMNHAQLTYAYYQEKIIDKATFEALHANLEQSQAIFIPERNLGVELDALEARIQILEAKP